MLAPYVNEKLCCFTTAHRIPDSGCCAHLSPKKLSPCPSSSLQEASTEDCPVKMKLVAPPLYVLTTQTLDKAKGVEVRA
jgi:hypothetical protein